MQCQDDLPIPSETPLNLKMFNARLTRSLIPASSCGFRLKDFELPIQDESEVQLCNLSVGLLQCSRSGVHRKDGNVALISPTGVPGLDQQRVSRQCQLMGIEFPEFHVECKTARLINDYVTLRRMLVNPSR